MRVSYRLRIDPTLCEGRGLCGELFPERVTLDDWGYPIIDPQPFGPELEAVARRTVKECPLLALRLEEAKKP